MINKTPTNFISKLPAHINSYNGKLTIFNKKDEKKAASLYNCQIQRCYYAYRKEYKYYGKIGIKVNYSKKDFIAWYLHYIKEFKGKNPTIGRIDHSKNYSFDNIEIQDFIDNCKERVQRNCKSYSCFSLKKVNIIDFKSGIIIKTVENIFKAQAETGVNINSIKKYCNGTYQKTKTGITFKFASEKNIKNFERKSKRLITIYESKEKTPIFIAKNYKEIFILTKISPSHVIKYCENKLKNSKNGYFLRYWSGDESKLYSL